MLNIRVVIKFSYYLESFSKNTLVSSSVSCRIFALTGVSVRFVSNGKTHPFTSHLLPFINHGIPYDGFYLSQSIICIY